MWIRYFCAVTIAIFTLLQGCSTQQEKTPVQATIPTETTSLTPEQQISRAYTTDDPQERNRLFLQAAEQYRKTGQNSLALSALKQITSTELPGTSLHQYYLLYLATVVDLENRQGVEKILKLIPVKEFNKASIDEQQFASQLFAKAYLITKNYLQSAITLIENAGLFPEEQYWENQEQAWQRLSKTSKLELNQFQYNKNNYEVQGWLALAKAIRQNDINLEQQYTALQEWKKKWPDHPAALKLPQELQLLEELPQTAPQKITLALPLSGPLALAGKAVKEGFLAAAYEYRANQIKQLEISIFDTHTNPLASLYGINNSESDKADLIVGPLKKVRLKELTNLAQDKRLPIPTLALNYLLDTKVDTEVPTNLYQFGLSPDDEMVKLNKKLDKYKRRRIAAILPDKAWAAKSFEFFESGLSLHEGKVITKIQYRDERNLSAKIAELLAVKESRQRMHTIRNLTGESIEFTPRRRQDIDAIVLIARPELARQIKPLLSFYFAADLPVYATSNIYNGFDENNHNSDLNGIQFTEIPWMLNNTNLIRHQLNKAWPELAKSYERLFALGVDAFTLAPRIKLLEKIPDSQLDGQTGRLSMNSQLQIHRDMEWARFERGKPVVLEH